MDRVLKGAKERIKRQLPLKEKGNRVEELIEKVCKKENISIPELRSGSRRERLPMIRLQLSGVLLEEYGLSLAELGRRLGVTTSAVSKMVSRHEKNRLR